MTAEDLANLGTLLKAVRDNDGELPDEVAEQVAGGAFDITKLGDLPGSIGGFLQAMAEPINKLIGIFTADDSANSGNSDTKQA